MFQALFWALGMQSQERRFYFCLQGGYSLVGEREVSKVQLRGAGGACAAKSCTNNSGSPGNASKADEKKVLNLLEESQK